MANQGDVNININVDTSQAIKATHAYAASSVKDIQAINAALSGHSQAWQRSASSVNDVINNWKYSLKASSDVFKNASMPSLNVSSNTAQAAKGIDEVTASTKKLSTAVSGINSDHFPRLRYALYDVSSAATVVGRSLTSVASSVFKTTADYESAFTSVERTTGLSGDAAEKFKKQLMELTTQIPLTFKDIAGITTLGAQMGIANKDLLTFTKTIAEFSAVSGMSAEEVAKSFGSLSSLLGFSASEFVNFGSAVAKAGNESVATEAEILKMATKIGGVAATAKISTENVVGLSAALASIRVSPELARGTLITVFQQVNRAVAEGGPKLQGFANIMGMTSDEVAKLAQTDMSKFFNTFVSSLRGLSATEITQQLDALGLSQIRVTSTLLALSNTFENVTKYQESSSLAYANGVFLAEKYAQKVDDINSKLTMLESAFKNLGVTVGSQFSGPIGFVLDALKTITIGFTNLVATGPGQVITGIGVSALALGGILAGTIAVLARFYAANLAARTAVITAAEAGNVASASYLNFAGSLTGVNVTAAVTAAATEKLTADLYSGRIGLQVYTQGLMELQAAQKYATAGAKLLKGAIVSTGIGALVLGVVALGSGLWEASMGSKELRNAQGQTKEEFEAANKEIDQQNEELKNLSNNITSTAAAVRTLGDYASDLSSIFKRSFELRFDRQSTFDAITSGWASIAKASQDANDNILELNATVKSLSADKALKQYFLSVAEAYGDAVSAARLRADIAGIDANLASKTQELTAAQDKSNKTLKGNSAAAIANRNTVRGMVTNYQAYIESLIKSGASQATINKAIRDGKADFIAQATQLGYNTTELQTYTAAFDDMVQIVKSVPSNVNVKFTASMTAADKALAEFAARAKASGSTAGKDFADAFNNGVKKANDKFIPVAKKPTFGENLLTNIGIIFDWISGASYKPLVPLWANGGYTGAGGKYEPAGIVHKGEYVVPASQVNQNTGMPYYMQQQRSFASGGFARASGPMMVTLAPEDRALLRNVGGSGEVVLYANNEAIARSSNAGNKSIVAAGGRP